jgi:S-adenosylmethionine decarboxylase
MQEISELAGASVVADKFGMHLTVDLAQCNPARLCDLGVIHDLLLTLCSEMRMHALTKPYAFKYDGNGCEADAGITGFLILAESHISIHTYPHKQYAFIDMFSCRKFEQRGVLVVLNAALDFKVHTLQLLSRGHDFPR